MEKDVSPVMDSVGSPNSKNRNHWKITSIVLGVIVIFFIGMFVFRGTILGMATGNAISESDASNKLLDYFNAVLGGGVEFIKSSDLGDIYMVTLKKDTQQADLYITKDGKYLISGIEEISLDQTQAQQEQASAEIPKTAKPEVDLYVMSFCPYGMQAENIMKPVYDLLKAKANFNIKFIVNIAGDTIDGVDSLHGLGEAKEDARQVCIARDYPNKLWDYVLGINEECSSLYREDTQMNPCWKKIAEKNGISTAKVESCFNADAVNLLKAHEAASNENGVTGSPTIIINGVRYSGARTADAIKSAVCSAFTDESLPAECEQAVTSSSAESSAPAGSC